MPVSTDLEYAKQKILLAQGALEDYLSSAERDIATFKLIAEELRVAIDDFLSQLTGSCRRQ